MWCGVASAVIGTAAPLSAADELDGVHLLEVLEMDLVAGVGGEDDAARGRSRPRRRSASREAELRRHEALVHDGALRHRGVLAVVHDGMLNIFAYSTALGVMEFVVLHAHAVVGDADAAGAGVRSRSGERLVYAHGDARE